MFQERCLFEASNAPFDKVTAQDMLSIMQHLDGKSVVLFLEIFSLTQLQKEGGVHSRYGSSPQSYKLHASGRTSRVVELNH
jgi:hypothetical protein